MFWKHPSRSWRGALGVNPSKVLLVMSLNGVTPNGYTVNVFSCYFYCQDLSHLMSHKVVFLSVCACTTVCVCVCGYSSMPVSLCVFVSS